MDHSEHFEITVIPYRLDSEMHSTLLPTMLCFLETQRHFQRSGGSELCGAEK